MNDTPSLEQRLGSAESHIEHFGQRFDQIDARFASVDRKFEGIEHKIDDSRESLAKQIKQVSDVVSQHGQISWHLIVSILVAAIMAAGLCIAIGGLVVFPILRDAGHQYDRTGRLEDALAGHMQGGHPNTVLEKMKVFESNYKETKSELKQEVSKLDQNIEQAYQKLDGHLQNELRLATESTNRELSSIAKRLEEQAADDDNVVYWRSKAERYEGDLQRTGQMTE